MAALAGPVETQSAMWSTYADNNLQTKDFIPEATDNVISATKKWGMPAVFRAILGPVGPWDTWCLTLSSHTAVKDASTGAMIQMFTTGPSEGSQGPYNQKGIGTRVLQAGLGGCASGNVAADLLVFSVDASQNCGAVARIGPELDEAFGKADPNNKYMARVAAQLVFDSSDPENVKATIRFPSGPQSFIDEALIFQSNHPFTTPDNNGATRLALEKYAVDCYNQAMRANNLKYTAFIYWNLGTTTDGKPLLDVEDGRIVCNDFRYEVSGEPFDLCTVLREAYLPNTIGLYPIDGIDDNDYTRGNKDWCVQDCDVFSEKSWYEWTHNEEGVIKSDVLKIDLSDDHIIGQTIYMRAYWPVPPREVRDGTSERRHLDSSPKYCTGTYFVFRDKVINPHSPKMLNERFCEANSYNNIMTILSGISVGSARGQLFSAGLGQPLIKWLGFNSEQEYADFGFPTLATMRDASQNFDKARLFEMMGCGAVFVARIDQVAGLDFCKTTLAPKKGSRLVVDDIIYAIRRAQVRWCLDNKPQERLKKDADNAVRALARQAAAAARQGQPDQPDAGVRAQRDKRPTQSTARYPEEEGASGSGGKRRKANKKPVSKQLQASLDRVKQVVPPGEEGDAAFTSLMNELKKSFDFRSPS